MIIFFLHLDNTLTDAYSSNDDRCKIDFSAMDESYQDDFAIGQIYESTYINEESTSHVIQDLDTVRVLDDLFCHVCNDNSNSIDSQALSTLGQSLLNSTQEVSYENVSNDETPVAAATIPEATNAPIINDLALARE